MENNSTDTGVDMKKVSEWMKYMEPSETPITQKLPGPPPTPDFCFASRKVPVEPYHSIYQDLWDILEMITPEFDEEEWGQWHPSPAAAKLRGITLAIGSKSYAEVENPGYDEEKCLNWKKENMPAFMERMKKMEWGPVPMDHIEDTVIITPEGPRVVDQEEEA